MMLLGARGTLDPDPHQPSPLGSGERWADRCPPHIEHEVARQLGWADKQLRRVVPAAHFIFVGQPVPLNGLRQQLSQHLADLLTFTTADELHACSSGLTRLLRRTTAAWLTATSLFLSRLHKDAPYLAIALGESLPALRAAEATNSDPHLKLGAVLKLVFCNGLILFYKPRAVTGEWLWTELLTAVSLPAPRVLSLHRELRYGWIEAIQPEPNPDPARFWPSAGALLCLAQHVHLTDLHLGNLVATAEGPAVTDAECFANPPRPQPTRFHAALNSLLLTGLLPTPGSPATSGLFGRSGSPTGEMMPRWAIAQDGTSRLIAVPAVLAAHVNAPAVPRPLAVLGGVREGYLEAAARLQTARAELIDPQARWRQTLEVLHAPRIVARDTLRYATLLSRSLAVPTRCPRLTRAQYLLHALRKGEAPTALCRAEARALYAACIPRFHLLPGTCSLADCSGTALAPSYAAYIPAQAVLASLESLSPETLREDLLPALLAAFL